MSDLDLIIMGGYFGEWRNANKIHGFSVGVANTWEDEWGMFKQIIFIMHCFIFSFHKI